MHRRYREKEAMPTNEVIMYNTLSDWLPLDSPALVISKFVDEFVNEKIHTIVRVIKKSVYYPMEYGNSLSCLSMVI